MATRKDDGRPLPGKSGGDAQGDALQLLLIDIVPP
jgi:hypothetical protein